MSDRQSKNYDEGTKVLLSCVAERTRFKRGASYGTSTEAHGISSDSQNVEAATAFHNSFGISAPIAQRKQNSSSCISKAGLGAVSAPHDCRRPKKRRKIQSKPSRRICWRKNNLGNNSRDMNLEEIEIERIDEAEFNKMKTHSASKMKVSTWQELDEGSPVASSRKNVNSMMEKPSAYPYRCISPEDIRHGSHLELFLQRGNYCDMVRKEMEIENMGGVKFSSKKTQSMSKIGPSTRQGINGHFAATSSKSVGCVSKNIFCGPFSPMHDNPHSKQGWRDKSSSILQKGKDNKDMDFEGVEVEVIEEAEFNNMKTHSASNIKVSTWQELDEGSPVVSSRKNVNSMMEKPSAHLYRCMSPEDIMHGSDQELFRQRDFQVCVGNYCDMVCKEMEIENMGGVKFSSKKTQSMSKIGPSTRRGINGHFAATSGKGKKDMNFEGVEVEVIGEAEFMNQKKHFMPKIGLSTKEEANEGYSVAAPRNVGNISKKTFLTDCCESSFPEDACHCSDQLGLQESSSSPQRENNNESTSSDEIMIERIDEAVFRSQISRSEAVFRSTSSEEIMIERIDEAVFKSEISCSASKIGSSTKRVDKRNCAANSWKNADVVKEVSCDNSFGSFSSQKTGSDSDEGQTDMSSSFAEKGDNKDDVDSKGDEIEKIDESEFRTHLISKIGSSTSRELRQGYFAATSGKNANSTRKKMSSKKKIDKKKKINQVASCSRRTKSDQDWNRNLKDDVNNSSVECMSSYSSSYSISENISGFTQDDEISSYTERHEINLGIASRTRSKMRITKNPSKVDNVSLDLSEDSDSSDSGCDDFDDADFGSESSCDSEDIELPYLHAEACEIQKSISVDVSAEKIEDFRKQEGSDVNHVSKSETCEVQKNISVDVSAEKIEGSRKQEGSDMNHVSKSETCEVRKNISVDVSAENIEDSRKQEGSDVNHVSKSETCEVRKYISVDVSAEKIEDSRNKEGSDVNHVSKRKRLSNIQKKETGCKQPTFQRPELPSRKRHLSHEASSRRTKEKPCKENGVLEENEEIERILGDHGNVEEVLEEKRNTDKTPKCTNSKQSYTQKDCDEVEVVNGLHAKDPPQAGSRMQRNEDSPSHSKHDCSHSDNDDIQENFDATSSDFHGHGKNETVDVADEFKKPEVDVADEFKKPKVDVADELKKPTKQKKIPLEKYDFCTMLADSILGKGPMLEMKESDEEANEEEETKKEPASQTESSLPLKFRFEDEVPKEVEKTEYEKEMEELFAEAEFNWALEELGSFNYPEVDQETGNSPVEETQHARCTKGMHELVLQDEEGLICIYCHHVVLGPKDVMPEWVEKIYREPERRRCFESEHPLEFDGVHLQSSIDNSADFGNTSDGTVWNIKPGIRESMYEHQQEGFEFLWKNLAGSINLEDLKSTDPGEVGGCIISHAPGTGKTRLTIVFIESYLKLFPNCHPMIIAPASMLLTWEEEFRKWDVEFPFLNLNNLECLGNENKTALGLMGGTKRRDKDGVRWVKIYSWDRGRSILGISYSLFEKLTGEKHSKEQTIEKRKRASIDDQIKALRKVLLEKPGLVVLDEGHTPRNQRSNIWNVLLKLQTERRVILSGTPFQNNFAELFNTLRIVRPAIANALAQERTFSEMITARRMSSGRKNKGEHHQSSLTSEVIDRAVEKLKVSMSPFVHVHKGTILKQSLPGLRDCVVLLKPPALQKSLIERLEGLPSTFEFEHKVALISVHPYLFQQYESTEEQRIGIDLGAVEASRLNPNEGVKTRFILEFVRLSMAMKEKLLIFSQYIQPLELIKEQLKKNFKWVDGKQILQMQGRLDQKQRQILINLFNDPQSDSKIMLASTKCCSEGISLVGASRVILLDVVWNPSVERQAISRAYRIGQKKFVYTYHLMTSGTTEADKYCRQAEKERLSELVFSSSNESNKQTCPSLGIEDRILEEMVGHVKLNEMFEKIINQPKDADLIQTFGLTS